MSGEVETPLAEQPCLVKYGWCQCGIFQCGRPYHGEEGETTKGVALKGDRCVHEAYYENRKFNPSVRPQCPELMPCAPGDAVSVMTNPREQKEGGEEPAWEKCTLVSVSLDGTLAGHLTILVRLRLRRKGGGEIILHVSLWEPGITPVELHEGSAIDGMRALIMVDPTEKAWVYAPPAKISRNAPTPKPVRQTRQPRQPRQQQAPRQPQQQEHPQMRYMPQQGAPMMYHNLPPPPMHPSLHHHQMAPLPYGYPQSNPYGDPGALPQGYGDVMQSGYGPPPPQSYGGPLDYGPPPGGGYI